MQEDSGHQSPDEAGKDPQVSDEALEMRRLRLLIDQLKNELIGEEGASDKVWAKIAAAFDMAISESYVRKIASGERANVSVEKLSQIERAMKLSWRFLHDPRLGKAPSYRDHLRGSEKQRRPEFDRFLGIYAHITKLTETQIDQLAEMEFRGGPTVDKYVKVAEAMLREGDAWKESG